MENTDCLETSPEHFSMDFSHDHLLSLHNSSDANAKLEFLSNMMSCLDSQSEECNSFPQHFKKQEWKMSFLYFLKSCLTLEKDRYVIFSARKVLTSLIRTYNSEEGLKIVDQLLDIDGQLELICMGLQICRSLLSLRSDNLDTMVIKLGILITKTWQYLTSTIQADITYDQCLLELFSVCIKMAKIVKTNAESSQAILILNDILSDGGETINAILFDRSIKDYVKTKLICFLCIILRMLDLSHVQVLRFKILRISLCLFDKLASSDTSSILRKNEKTIFIGIHSNCNKRSLYDVAGIRDWTFLCLCLSSCLTHHGGYQEKITAFLLKLDDSVKELWDREHLSVYPWLQDMSTSFLWLPDIYGDQDDKWIDALILLMEIFPSRRNHSSLENEEIIIQHHLYFLQFVRTLGYDHLVLIDLLTSPETNCLVYLIKYLKYLLDTWNEFVTHACKRSDENSVFLTNNDIEQSNGNISKISQTEMLPHQSKLADKVEEMCKKVTDDIIEIQRDEGEKANRLLEDHEEKCSGITEKVRIERSSSQILAASSLLMIADAYNQDDDEIDDYTEINNEMGGDNDSNNDNDFYAHSNEGNVNEIVDAFSNQKGADANKLDINITLKKDELYEFIPKKADTFLNRSETINDVKGDSFSEDSIKPKDGHVSENCENFKVLELCTSETVATVASSLSGEFGEIDKDFAADDDTNDILDKVMGMLIRTRLQLDKLNDSCLMKYNPLVLVNLMEAVEELYENTCN